jgi:hypothetical protein
VVAPWISVTASRVYYLDGPSDISWLKPDGSKGLATSIAVSARQQVSFAVSSDDKLLAVSVLSYGPRPSCGNPCLIPTPFLGTQLSVGDLAGGRRTTIFTSAKVPEVPVGWNSGNLVVGVVPPNCCQSVTPSSFSVTEYHVVNPANGNRIWTVCPAPGHALGHPQPGGSLCGSGKSDSGLTVQAWNGKSTSAGLTTHFYKGDGFLSPNGTKVAFSGSGVTVQEIRGRRIQLIELGDVMGWFDSDHLAALSNNLETAELVLVDLRKAPDGLEASFTRLPPLQIVGVFPGGLD